VAFHLAGASTEQRLRPLRIAVVVMAAGFYLQVLPSLMSLTTNQFIATQRLGHWASKAIFTPDSTPACRARPDIQLYVWLRLKGDVVAGAGIAVFLIHMLRALPRAIS
jgi:nitric oxide reductase subunit B